MAPTEKAVGFYSCNSVVAKHCGSAQGTETGNDLSPDILHAAEALSCSRELRGAGALTSSSCMVSHIALDAHT